jgi:hypothetical protein
MTQLDLFDRPKRRRDRDGERELLRILSAAAEAPPIASMSRARIKRLMTPLPKITASR